MTLRHTRFAYLLYVSRSGSTMLANQIAGHIDGALVFPELDFVGRLFEHGDDYIRRQSAKVVQRLIASDTKSETLGLSERHWHDLLLSTQGLGIIAILDHVAKQYAIVRNQAPPVVAIFQRGTLLSVVPEIIQCDPSASFIHIYRDPRAAISSVAKIRSRKFREYDSRSMGRVDAVGLSRNWLKYVRRVDYARTRWPTRILNIRYEDYCANNVNHLAEIAKFLQRPVRHDPVALNQLEVARNEVELHTNISKPPTTCRIDAWKQELPRWRGWIIERFTRPLLTQKGYVEYFLPQAPKLLFVGACVLGIGEWAVESVRPAFSRICRFLREPRLFLRVLLRPRRDSM